MSRSRDGQEARPQTHALGGQKFRFAWPPTLTHKAVSAVYPNDSNKPLQEFAMKQTLATMKDNQKSLIWSKMTIPMPVPVVPGHPTIRFVEAPADTPLLGQQYKNFPVRLFDRFICVDLSLPSKVFAVKKQPTPKILSPLDLEEDSDSD